jgi:predicted outer membrane repeat protein
MSIRALSRVSSLLAAIALTIPCVPVTPVQAACTVYVNAAAAAGGDGTSWSKAYSDLRVALAASSTASGCEVDVAEGTYKPSTTGDRTASFVLKSGVTVNGGYHLAAGGSVWRDFRTYPSILSGDLNGNDGAGFTNTSDNSYHVVTANDGAMTSTAVLDGFTIRGGHASGAYPNYYGGGLYILQGTPTLRYLTITANYADIGGGVFLGSLVHLTDSTVSGNAGQNGAGVATQAASTLARVTVASNQATVSGGGIYAFNNSSPVFANLLFIGNTAPKGAALADSSSSPSLINATITGNSALAAGGAAIYNQKESTSTSSPSIRNTILWNNSNGSIANDTVSGANTAVISYSLVEGCKPDGAWNAACGSDAGHNLVDVDPQIIDPANANLRLPSTSPAIDAGDDSVVSGAPGISVDFGGNPRLLGSHVDLGAYELKLLYVDSRAAIAGATGVSWGKAYPDLQLILPGCGLDCEIWVAEGTYKPSNSGDTSQGFHLLTGVSIYGGFAGTETSRTQRDWLAHPTILSGDLNGDDAPGQANTSDNSKNVVIANFADLTTCLDGFSIQGGNSSYSGGGMGVWSSQVRLANLNFHGNHALFGGGIFTQDSSISLTNVIFSGNVATTGGGIYADHASLDLVNAVFLNNQASTGAGIYNDTTSSSEIINSTFVGNSASNAAAIYNYYGAMSLTNSISWGNSPDNIFYMGVKPTLSYTLASGCKPAGVWSASCGTDGGSNLLDADPRFMDVAHGDLHLHAGSPAINKGNNDAISAYPTDLDGNQRIRNSTADLGAYEYIYTAPTVGDFAKNGNIGRNVAFRAYDFSSRFTDPNEGNLVSVKIASLPEQGALALAGMPVSVGQEIPVASLAGLTYSPRPDWTGEDGFSWNGSDGVLYAAAPARVTITISMLKVYLPNVVR